LICNISDPVIGQPYSRDPRYIARKAETYLTSARIGDRAYFGRELEHFAEDEVHCDQGVNYGYYEIDGRGELEGVSKPPLFASCVAVADPSWRLR
jgi:glutamine synthetase